jgi:ribulose-phosphate 3-epimerase
VRRDWMLSRSAFGDGPFNKARNSGALNDSDSAKIAPSILAADFARLDEQVGEAEGVGADRIHVDVMDGHFVPNISMGAPIVASFRHVTRLALETHLMISVPDSFIDEFIHAGSDSFLVHWEGNHNLHRTVQNIQQFLYTTLQKIRAVRRTIDRFNPSCDLEVDGGIDHETARLAVDAGANVLVAGSTIFGDAEGVISGMQNLGASLGMVKQ